MNIHANIEAIRDIASTIREMLGEDFDDQTFLDTLDGETDAMDMLGHLIKSRVEAQETEKAMKEIAATYAARAKRFNSQAAACVKGMGKLLDAIGEKRVTHKLGTVSRAKPRVSLDIEDPALIPSQLCKSVPDNTAIKAQLEAGESVPGASLKTGEPGLTVRVK